MTVFSQEREFNQESDVDSQLYAGFSPSRSRGDGDHPHHCTGESGSLAIQVADKRIEPLLFRYRARHYPHTLTDAEQRRWAAHCRDYFERNLEGYMLNLENLVHEHQADPKKMAILKSVYHYVEKLAC